MFLARIAIAALIAFSGLVVLSTLSIPIPGDLHIYSVETGSMEPSIKTGSVVFVAPAENYKIGDVITFWIRRDRACPSLIA